MRFIALAAMLIGGAAQAQAADKPACGVGMICAASPETVVAALQAQGYRARLNQDDPAKPPQIASAANGYNFDIYFEGCKNGKDCTSLTFWVSFVKDPANSPELANDWNSQKRFSTMSFDKSDGSLAISYDVTTVGGLKDANFADVIDWWASLLGAARKFFQAHPAGTAP